MKGHKRADRVAKLIRQEVGSILLTEFHDPTVTMVSVTDVHVSDDLRTARIYYTILGEEGERDEVAERLEQVTPRVRRQLGAGLRMKYVPALQFRYDDTLKNARKIESILDTIREHEDGEST